MAADLSRKAPFLYSWNCQDTEVLAINSLVPEVSWANWELPYMFPPLAKVLGQKVKEILIVVPWWPGKTFFTTLQSVMFDCCRIRPFRNMIIRIQLTRTQRQ